MNWLSSKKTIWISGAFFLLSQGILYFILRDVDSSWNLLHHQTTFSPEVFENTMNAWGPEKTARFLAHYYLDCFHPAFFGIFFASCLARLHSKHWLVILPFVAAFADEIENLIQSQLVMRGIPLDSPLFYVGAAAANLKWLLLTVSFFAIVFRLRRQ